MSLTQNIFYTKRPQRKSRNHWLDKLDRTFRNWRKKIRKCDCSQPYVVFSYGAGTTSDIYGNEHKRFCVKCRNCGMVTGFYKYATRAFKAWQKRNIFHRDTKIGGFCFMEDYLSGCEAVTK